MSETWFYLLQVGSFLCVLLDSSTNKMDHLDIAEILLKVALNTVNQPKPFTKPTCWTNVYNAIMYIAHWNNNPQVDMPLNTFYWLLRQSREIQQISMLLIVNRTHDLLKFHTLGKHVSHSTINALNQDNKNVNNSDNIYHRLQY